MRQDPARLRFEIVAREGSARAGILHTPHGPVETPAFVPLATRGSVKGLSSADLASLGFEMILGNTYHLMLAPGEELLAELGGMHGFAGWDRALISDSGGFQVFSLAHGGVADEIKGRRGGRSSHGSVLSIGEDGVAFRSYLDGSPQLLTPQRSMAVQAAIGADIALVFDECTPFHADFDYTAASTERTHRWLDRCLRWHGEHGPSDQAVYGIVQGGVYPELRARSVERVAAAAVDGIAIGGTLGRDKPQMRAVLAATLPQLPVAAPRHLLGIGEPDDLIDSIGLGIETFDCAVPTRLGRHGVALGPDPERRYRFEVAKARYARDPAPLVDGCPCPTCAGHSRAYLRHLAKIGEITAARLLTIHNLAYTKALVEGARAAIVGGRFAAYAGAIRAGETPWQATAPVPS